MATGPHDAGTATDITRKRRMPVWAWLLVALGIIVIAALIFVTVNYLVPTDSRSPIEPSQLTPSISEEPPPTEATAPPAPAPIVLPSCETLLPELYAVSAELAARLSETEIRYGNVGFDRFPSQFGPAAQATLESTKQSQGCAYPTTLESGVWIYSMELPAESRQAFLSALRADGDFTESTNGGAQVFIWDEALDGGHWSSAYTTHAFIGDVWIASFGSNPPETFIPTVSAVILAANPELR